jgi:hypothetical protein
MRSSTADQARARKQLAAISVYWERLSVLRIAEAGDAAMAGDEVEGIEV